MLRPALALCLIAAAFAGCGGGGEGEKVKDALWEFVSASKENDGKGICDRVTPESRGLLDVIARGRIGPDGDCPAVVDAERTAAGTWGSIERKTIDDADVDIKGDVARLKSSGDEQRLPMRKEEGEWRVDLANVPGGSLKATATCTSGVLSAQRRALPPGTRAGIAAEAERDAKELEKLADVLAESGPPPEKKEDHELVLQAIRANARSWRQAASGLRGLGEPLDTYNKALMAISKRSRKLAAEQRGLSLGCFGTAETVEGGREYRSTSHRICRAALRRVNRTVRGTVTPAALRRLRGGAGAARQLGEVDPPEGLERMHGASLKALSAAYAQLPQVARAADAEKAQMKIELLGLRSSVGFLRIGLPVCAQL